MSLGRGLSQLCQGDEASVPAQPPSGLTPLSWTPASGRGFWGQRHLHTLNPLGGLVPSGQSWPRQTGASCLAGLPGGRLGSRSGGRRSVRTQTGLASTFRPSMLAQACGLGEGSWGRTHAPGLRIGGASAGHPAPPLELGGGPCTARGGGASQPPRSARSGGSVVGSTSLPGPGEGGRFRGAGGRSQAPSSVPQPCPAGRAAGPSAPPPNAACRCPLTHSPRCARATRGPTPASVPHPAPTPALHPSPVLRLEPLGLQASTPRGGPRGVSPKGLWTGVVLPGAPSCPVPGDTGSQASGRDHGRGAGWGQEGAAAGSAAAGH